MAFYASYRSIPELSALEARERRAIWVAAYRQGWWNGPRNWVAAIVGVVVLPGSWFFLAWQLSAPFPLNVFITVLLSSVGGGFMGHVATQSALPYIRSLLSQRSSIVGT